ncbi:MAG: hypothetical protein IKD50_11705 [Clostridia bacterium]|nr:hypothetical protein [Clostridia bacterium]
MNRENDEKNKLMIEEQAATIRLFTDLTKAGSWVIQLHRTALRHLYNGVTASAG